MRWPRSAIACGTGRFPRRSRPMRPCSRRRRWRPISRRRSTAGPSSARRCGRTRWRREDAVLRAMALGGPKSGGRVIQLLSRAVAECRGARRRGRCRSRRRRSGLRVASGAADWPDADVDGAAAARRRPGRLWRRHPAVRRARSHCARRRVGRAVLAAAVSAALAWLVHASCSTACWRSAICCIMSGGSSGSSRDDLPRARAGVSALVGRDTERMDGAACRRAAVESLSENLTDGFVSPVVLVRPRRASRTRRCSRSSARWTRWSATRRRAICASAGAARGWTTSMNYVPARLTWLVIAALAAVLPGYSGAEGMARRARQHALLPGPNSGWSEAAAAGALERRSSDRSGSKARS